MKVTASTSSLKCALCLRIVSAYNPSSHSHVSQICKGYENLKFWIGSFDRNVCHALQCLRSVLLHTLKQTTGSLTTLFILCRSDINIIYCNKMCGFKFKFILPGRILVSKRVGQYGHDYANLGFVLTTVCPQTLEQWFCFPWFKAQQNSLGIHGIRYPVCATFLWHTQRSPTVIISNILNTD
jgi:hypothetical protein